MALTAARVLEFEGPPEYIEPKVAASDTYYRGMILNFLSGHAAAPTDGAAQYPAGVVDGKFENGVQDYAYVVASGANPRARLARGQVWLPLSGAAITDVGTLCYIADDTSLTKSAGSKTVAYEGLDFKTGYILVDLRHPIKVA